ncbi:hypothetical protein NP233_g10678 [Leucocoprinus birnbaumii]|uniref:Nephrocystin 3-like N-terminal domain-containing protein n=1 Tax=Leucocoprinus birnbaumii TaxID=56174 RepID=A0AAD5VNV0_9AGAR|nr:hypothetical protein NP233_g10678 [Leucocoprinus birnbaumii]
MVFDSFIDSLRTWTSRLSRDCRGKASKPGAAQVNGHVAVAASESTPPPGFFTNASNFVVQHQELTNVNKNTYNMITSGNTALNHLAPYTNPDAAVDSSARWPPPQCHPGTRATICAKLMSWLHDTAREWKFIWLWGSAGCGKSAVAQTFAEKCLEIGRLVVPSLAYQLATHCPPYKALIASRLADDPQLLTKAIPVQFKKLIIEPFSELQRRGHVSAKRPFVVILDGVDECMGESVQCEIVKQIEEAVRLKKDLPLIWMVCSRPEAHLKYMFARIAICRPEELAIDGECRTDVERYLISGLSELQVKYDIDPSWPPVEKLKAVSKAGSGHFVFVATALGFIGDENCGDPVKRFDMLIAFLEAAERKGVVNPLAKLDYLYTCILADISEDVFPTTWRILAYLMFARDVNNLYSKFLYKSAQALCNFINIDRSAFYSALRKLHSVIAVPLPKNAAITPLRFYHASFQDYLIDANRSGRFAVEEKRALIDITKSLFHWHELDAARFHPQAGPRYPRSHDHAALPGLKWTSGLDVESLSSDIADFGSDWSWKGCEKVGPDPDLLSYVFQLDMRHLYINLTSWCGFVNQCYEKGLLGDFCRTEPSEEFDTLLLDRLKMMTNQELVEPASFPPTWNKSSDHKFREYVLMGYGSKSAILWFTRIRVGESRLERLVWDQEPSQSRISEYQEWLQEKGWYRSQKS